MDTKIAKNANNIMWVEYWVRRAHPSYKEYEITADRYDDYRWVCEIELPLINKTVEAKSEKEIDAMINASNKAAKLINKYMVDHPELNIPNIYKNKHYSIIGDEDGKFISMGQDVSMNKRYSRQTEKRIGDSFKAIKKAVAKIAKINGTTKNMFIKVVDQSLLDDEKTIKEIVDEESEKLMDEHPLSNNTICYDKDDGLLIVIGYDIPKSELEKEAI